MRSLSSNRRTTDRESEFGQYLLMSLAMPAVLACLELAGCFIGAVLFRQMLSQILTIPVHCGTLAEY